MRELNKMWLPVLCGTVYITETDDSLVLLYRATKTRTRIWLLVTIAGFVLLMLFGGAPNWPDPVINIVPLVFCGLYALGIVALEERLVLGPTGLDYRRSFIVPLRNRHIPLAELKHLETRRVRVHESNHFVWWFCLCVVSRGHPLYFAPGMTAAEAAELVYVATQFCRIQLPDVPMSMGPATPAGATAASSSRDDFEPVVVQPTEVLTEPPSDSQAWLRHDLDFGEIGWRCRWRTWRIRALFPLTFIATWPAWLVLWSLIAAGAPVLAWLALSPLFAAWLGAFALLLFELGAPGWHRIWRFGRRGAACGYRGFGLSWVHRFPRPSVAPGTPFLDHMELCKRQPVQSRRRGPFGQPRADAPFALSLIQNDGMEWVRMEGLTEGDARWIAGILFARFDHWFDLESGRAIRDPVARPACPMDRDVQIALHEDGLLLTYHDRHPGRGWLLFLALLAWSVPCLCVCLLVGQKPGLGNGLVGLAFVIVWLLIAYELVIADRTWAYARLGPDGLTHRRRVGWAAKCKHMPLRDLKSANAGLDRLSLGQRPGAGRPPRRENCVVFDSLGEPIRFAAGITEVEQRWLISVVNRYLDALRPSDQTGAGAALPEDSPMQMLDTPNGLGVSFRGRWRASLIAPMTLAMLVCGGLVGGLVFWPNWTWSMGLLAVFFFPILIFTVVMVAWLASVTAPAWRLTWTFREDEIKRTYSVFGLGVSRRNELPALNPEVCRFEDDRRADLGRKVVFHPLVLLRPEANWSLRFARKGSAGVLEIDGLTEGEARWMTRALVDRISGNQPSDRFPSLGDNGRHQHSSTLMP